MQYRLLDDHKQIRKAFMAHFIPTYREFVKSHRAWLEKRNRAFTQMDFRAAFLWDRLGHEAREISFGDALAYLKKKDQEVLFLTESAECCVRESCRLNSRLEFVAAAQSRWLAEQAAYEWFTEYVLAEQGRYLADPILPSEVYIFDESYTWCLILTHETDETESAASRLCLLVEKDRIL